MTKFKSICIVLWIASLSVAVLSGCGGDKAANSGSSWETAPKVVVAVENKYDGAVGKSGDSLNDNPYARHIYEKTGVRPELVSMPYQPQQFSQVLSVKLAAGEQIDLIGFPNLQQNWMDTGTVITIDKIMNDNENLIPNILNNIPDDAWESAQKLENNGTVVHYGFPVRNDLAKPYLSLLFVRKDWLDNLGMALPKTTDELTEMFRAFSQDDPDKNGLNDTFGIGTTAGFNITQSWLQFWGVDIWRELEEDGKLIPAGHSRQARVAFKTIGEWYKGRYVDVEGITDGKSSETKLLNGKIGSVTLAFANVARFYEQMHDSGLTEAVWVPIDNPIISSYDQKPYYFQRRENRISVTQITASSKESNYPNILKMLDWMYSEEGTEFLEFGIEGREHNLVDGRKVKDSQYINADQKSYLPLYRLGMSYNTVYPEIFTENYEAAQKFAEQYKELCLTKSEELSFKPLDIKFKYPLLKSWKDYPDYRKGIETYVGKFVLNELDVMDDAVWNKYMEESDRYGFQKILDEAAELYYK